MARGQDTERHLQSQGGVCFYLLCIPPGVGVGLVSRPQVCGLAWYNCEMLILPPYSTAVSSRHYSRREGGGSEDSRGEGEVTRRTELGRFLSLPPQLYIRE